jgi:hypothetical protein
MPKERQSHRAEGWRIAESSRAARSGCSDTLRALVRFRGEKSFHFPI